MEAEKTEKGYDMKLLDLLKRRSPPKSTSTSSATPKEEITVGSLVAGDAVYKGNIITDRGLRMDGRVIGNVSVGMRGLLVIGKSGIVDGEIKARNLVVHGVINGNVIADRVILAGSAVLNGNLSYQHIRITEGANIAGTMQKIKPNEIDFSIEAALAEAEKTKSHRNYLAAFAADSRLDRTSNPDEFDRMVDAANLVLDHFALRKMPSVLPPKEVCAA